MAYSGIIVFDVDGVIFRDIFLKKIVQTKGILKYFRIISLGILYYLNKISFSELLREGYRLAGNVSVERAGRIASRIKRVPNAKSTIEILKKNNFYVSIISAGIPDFILKSLAEEIGADFYRGMSISARGNELDVDTIKVVSKVEVVESLLARLGLTWDKVISVGDDPYNMELFKKSRIRIGFNPSQAVRTSSDIIIESNDLHEILPHIIPQESLPKNLRKKRYYWKRELIRKGIHLLGCALPFLMRANQIVTISILGAAIFFFCVSELLRLSGMLSSPISFVTRLAKRHHEKGSILSAPITLGAGILLTLLLFDFSVYLPAVLIVSISDSLSAIIGKKYGKVPLLGLKNRTVEGSTAFFLSSMIILLFTRPVHVALAASILATLLELISFFNLDNLLIPLGTALFLRMAGGM